MLIAFVLPVVVLVTTATPAIASLHPQGCVVWADEGEGWQNNCWVGQQDPPYDNAGYYANGIQIILKGFGYYQGPLDGLFGPASHAAMVAYQDDRPPLTADGIVGTGTWPVLRDELFVVYSNQDYIYYSSPGWNNKRKFRLRWDPPNYPWYTRPPGGGGWAGFSVYGP
jgi:hypothetical protein